VIPFVNLNALPGPNRRTPVRLNNIDVLFMVNIGVPENTVYEVLLVETDATTPTAALVVGSLMRNKKLILDGFF
jgi:hypothetical protein